MSGNRDTDKNQKNAMRGSFSSHRAGPLLRHEPFCFAMRMSFFFVCFLASSVAVLAVMHACRQAGKSLPYSIYYEAPTAVDVALAEKERFESAANWMANVGKLGLAKKRAKFRPQLCVALLTAPRNERPSKYAAYALMSLVRELSKEERRRLHVLAVIRGRSPFRKAVRQQLSGTVRVKGSKSGDKNNLDDETSDYVRGLEACSATGAELVLVLQDDVIATRQWVSAVLVAARTADEASEWFSLKLFYTEFFEGWSVSTTPKLILFCALVFVAVLWSMFQMLKWLFGGISWDLLLVCLAVAFAAAFLAAWVPYSLGRQHVVRPFYDGLNPNRGSAAVAILYNNRHGTAIAQLIVHLKSRIGKRTPVDLDIDAFTETQARKLPSFVFMPSLFQHIGYATSIAHKVGKWRTLKVSLSWRESFFGKSK